MARECFVEALAPRLGAADEDGLALAVCDEVADGRPERGEDEHLVAGINDRLEGREKSLHAAVEDDDVLLAHSDTVALAQLLGDGRPQLGDAGGGCVARAVFGEGARHGLLDGVGRFEERLAALELKDLCAAGTQL
jgi:hypothetical protein